MTELSPRIACPVSGLCLESIVPSVLWNKSDLIMVDSWKELLRTIIFILIVVLPCLINLLDCNLCRSLFWNFFDLGWFFTGDDLMLDRLNFFMCFFGWLFLWCYWSLGFFVFKFKFLLWVQVRRINRTLDSFDFLLLFNFRNCSARIFNSLISFFCFFGFGVYYDSLCSSDEDYFLTSFLWFFLSFLGTST